MKDITKDTKLITRAECGLRDATSVTPFTAEFGSTVHYNGPPIGLSRLLANHSACFSTWRGIQAFHMGPERGWTDIAYTAGVCPHGYVFEGRGVGRRTAANGTNPGNDSAYAIFAFLGDGEAPNDAMKRAIVDYAEFLDQHGEAGPGINAHRDWKSTACPGDPLASWVADGLPRPNTWEDAFPMRQGDQGYTIMLLEIILVHSGFDDIIVEGNFGPQTMKAVHKMQELLKLGQRDVVRPADFEAMNNWSKLIADPDRPKTLFDRGPRIAQLREDLHRAGKLANSGGSVYDVQVQAAVKDVQEWFGARPSGNATVETMRFIHKLVNS